ncbi:hypothetical protein L345_17262, partial [Ophiophagus hannah]
MERGSQTEFESHPSFSVPGHTDAQNGVVLLSFTIIDGPTLQDKKAADVPRTGRVLTTKQLIVRRGLAVAGAVGILAVGILIRIFTQAPLNPRQGNEGEMLSSSNLFHPAEGTSGSYTQSFHQGAPISAKHCWTLDIFLAKAECGISTFKRLVFLEGDGASTSWLGGGCAILTFSTSLQMPVAILFGEGAAL